LVLTNLSTYTAHAPDLNGRSGCLGQLNIVAPGDATIKFSLVQAGTDVPVSAPTYEMTVFDLDSSPAGMTEKVGVMNYTSIEAVKLVPVISDAGIAWFEATEVAVPNPSNLDNMTTEQIEASFSVTYKDTSEWVVQFHAQSVDDTGNGRNFFFAGASCASANRHECTCPPPTPVPTPAPTPPCPVPKVCSCLDEAATSDKSYVDWNMCTSEIETGHRGFPIRYKEVSPSVDLVLTNLTAYSANSPNKNGRKGCVGQLNIDAPGNAVIQFTFVQSGTDIPVAVGPVYEMSVFDLDSSKGGMIEKVGVENYARLDAISLSPTISDRGIAWFTATSKAVANPSDLNNMTQEQLDASFSVTYTGTSQWAVHFHAIREGRRTGGRNFFFSGSSCASANRHRCECPAQEAKPEAPPPKPLVHR